MTTTTEPRTPLHDQPWQRSAKGYSVFTNWKDLHVSVYRRPNTNRLRFRLDGEFPAHISTTAAAIGVIWRRFLSMAGRP